MELRYEDLVANKDVSAEVEEVSAWEGSGEGGTDAVVLDARS